MFKTLIVVLMFVSWPSFGCQEGCVQFQGVCACDIKPEQAAPVEPSDEEPPRSGMPSYQAEGIHAEMPASLLMQDAQEDVEKAQAILAGQRAAGIPGVR